MPNRAEILASEICPERGTAVIEDLLPESEIMAAIEAEKIKYIAIAIQGRTS